MLPYNKGIDSGDYTYYIMEDGNAVIDRYRGEEESVVVPDKIDDVIVTALNNGAFKSNKGIKEITIPATVNTVYGNPFAECDYLETIKVADGNKDFSVIDGCLVKNDGMVLVSFPCNGGKEGDGELTIPEGILKIGDWSFSDVYSVSSIIMPESLVEVDDYAFIRSSVGAVTFNNKVEKIGKYGFAYCAFTELALPESLKSIGEMAFSGNYLTELVLPDSVEALSYNAFNNSSKLSSVTLSKSLANVDGNPFSSCPLLTEIKVADGNTNIEIANGCLINNATHSLIAFSANSDDLNVVVPDGIERIEKGAFSEFAIQSVKLPDSIKVICDNAFYNCTALTSINLPEGLKEIGVDCFSDCALLEGVAIPSTLEVLGASAFYRCESITEANVPGAVGTIDRYTFAYCYKLANVTLGEGIETIADGAFSCNYAITELVIPSTVKVIKDRAFDHCEGLTTLDLPKGLEEIKYYAFDGIKDLDLGVYEGSYAKEYCEKQKLNYHIIK